MGRRAGWALAALVVVCAVMPSVLEGQERSLVSRADFRIVMTSATTCDVTADLVLDRREGGDVVHRFQLFDGAQAELGGVTGATVKSSPVVDGRTMVLTGTASTVTSERSRAVFSSSVASSGR